MIRQVGTCFARARKHGARVLLMPQSFGPFEDTGDATRAALKHVDLTFTRDSRSFEHVSRLLDLETGAAEIHQSIDYTGCLPLRKPQKHHRYCIVVPNIKILERKGDMEYRQYLEWLRCGCVAAARSGLGIKVLSHTFGKDDVTIRDLVGPSPEFEVVRTDPLQSRLIIAGAAFVISSRFHGIINALTQNVPCATIGWSHKYDEAMARYGMQAFNVVELVNSDPETVVEALLQNSSSIRQRLEDVNRDTAAEYARIREVVLAAL